MRGYCYIRSQVVFFLLSKEFFLPADVIMSHQHVSIINSTHPGQGSFLHDMHPLIKVGNLNACGRI